MRTLKTYSFKAALLMSMMLLLLVQAPPPLAVRAGEPILQEVAQRTSHEPLERRGHCLEIAPALRPQWGLRT